MVKATLSEIKSTLHGAWFDALNTIYINSFPPDENATTCNVYQNGTSNPLGRVHFAISQSGVNFIIRYNNNVYKLKEINQHEFVIVDEDETEITYKKSNNFTQKLTVTI